MTSACMHLGIHKHPVKNREYQDFKDCSCILLVEQVERTPHATNSSIVMEATKELLGELLLRLEGVPANTFIFEELVCSNMPYAQENLFSGQGSDFVKVFVFKMSKVGLGSGIDMLKRMQSSSNLEDAWMMFDHVKCVKKWTTMACHVYDSTYCRVMTIAVCDMQSKDVVAQSILQKNLNVVIARHGIPEPKFKGFMADSAQAKWNAIWVI